MPVNATGNIAPNQDDLLLGAGVVYIDRWDADNNPTGLLDLGNVEKLELTTTDDTIQKFESRTKARNLYKESLRQRTVVLNLTMDEYNADNLSLIMQGDKVNSAAQAATPVAGEALTPAVNGLRLGGYYRVANYGAISAVVVNKAATPLVLGDDYTVDLVHGIIHILPAPATVGLADGDDLTVDYTPTGYTNGLTQVRGGTESKVRGNLLYISDPSEGPQQVLEVWQIRIKPDGALGFISTDFATMGLACSVEADAVNHPSEPLYRMTYL